MEFSWTFEPRLAPLVEVAAVTASVAAFFLFAALVGSRRNKQGS